MTPGQQIPVVGDLRVAGGQILEVGDRLEVDLGRLPIPPLGDEDLAEAGVAPRQPVPVGGDVGVATGQGFVDRQRLPVRPRRFIRPAHGVQ